MDPLILIVSVTVFFAVLSFITGMRRGGAEGGRMASRLEAFRGDGEAESAAAGDSRASFKKKRSYSGVPLLSTFLSQFKGSEEVALHLERAGVPLRVGEYYMMRWGLAVALFIAPFIFNQSAFMLLIAVMLAVMGYMRPP